MPNSYQKTRYSHSAIQKFVASQQDLVESTPLTEQQIQADELFKNTANKPDGPIDLLYRFREREPQMPALGFQQIDSEQDEDAMYSLVYIDQRLSQEWQNQGE